VFGIAISVAALFGFRTITVNGGWAFGLTGLVVGLLLALIFAVISSLGFLVGALVASRVPKLNELEIWRAKRDVSAFDSEV
jgi:hypothetical protein